MGYECFESVIKFKKTLISLNLRCPDNKVGSKAIIYYRYFYIIIIIIIEDIYVSYIYAISLLCHIPVSYHTISYWYSVSTQYGA